MAEQTVDAILDSESIKLNAAGQKFLCIYTHAETGTVIWNWLDTLFTPDNQPGAIPTL